MPKALKNKIPTEWSPRFAYGIGLIASDGCLSKITPRINFGSKELEMMQNFQSAFGVHNTMGKHARGGELEKKYFFTSFKSRNLYDFLLNIGITPAKSKTIKSVYVPDEFFIDFVRGLFDGDGSFYFSYDARWPKHPVYKTSFASASLDFLIWLKAKITKLYGLRGFFHNGVGVFILVYTKSETKRLFALMYHNPDILFLSRKYHKMKAVLEYDAQLHLQAGRGSSVARAQP